jgi:hypothetical protein
VPIPDAPNRAGERPLISSKNIKRSGFYGLTNDPRRQQRTNANQPLEHLPRYRGTISSRELPKNNFIPEVGLCSLDSAATGIGVGWIGLSEGDVEKNSQPSCDLISLFEALPLATRSEIAFHLGCRCVQCHIRSGQHDPVRTPVFFG